MIKIIGVLNEEINYKAVYNKSARVLNVESELMNDDCRAYDESTGCIVFLTENRIGEIECIYPVETEFTWPHNLAEAELAKGVPIAEINFEEKNVEIMLDGSKAVLFLSKKKSIDKKYVCGECCFYTADNEIVAISCDRLQII